MKCPLSNNISQVFKVADMPQGWNTNENGDSTCSFCGSWHPKEFLAFLGEVTTNDDINIRITLNDGRDKIYVQRPTVKCAGQGAIKVYLIHVKQYIEEKGLSMEKADYKLHKALMVSKAKFARYMEQFNKKP
jgi:hypothetical protein